MLSWLLPARTLPDAEWLPWRSFNIVAMSLWQVPELVCQAFNTYTTYYDSSSWYLDGQYWLARFVGSRAQSSPAFLVLLAHLLLSLLAC